MDHNNYKFQFDSFHQHRMGRVIKTMKEEKKSNSIVKYVPVINISLIFVSVASGIVTIGSFVLVVEASVWLIAMFIMFMFAMFIIALFSTLKCYFRK